MVSFPSLLVLALSLFIVVSTSLPSKLLHRDENGVVSSFSHMNLVHALALGSSPNLKKTDTVFTEHQQMTHAMEKESLSLKDSLPGKYVSIAEVMKSIAPVPEVDMGSCPSSVAIKSVVPVFEEGPGVYKIDYNSGLLLDGNTCVSSTEADTALKLYPTISHSPGDNEPNLMWIGLIPENTMQCGSTPAPQVSISVIPTKTMLKNLPSPPTMPGMESTPQMHSKFAIVAALDNTVCPFFLESDIPSVEALIHSAMNPIPKSETSPEKPNDEQHETMDPENILLSHFEMRQLCPCSSYFPKIVSFLPASLDEDASEPGLPNGGELDREISTQDSREQDNDDSDDEPTDMPMPIRWNGSLCPTKRVYPIGNVVSFTEKDQRNDKVKRLMLHGVVEKLFDEMSGEIRPNSMVAVSFKEKKTLLIEFGEGLEGLRGVLPFRQGSKCGDQNIRKDFVLLLEVYHILHQLRNHPIYERFDDKTRWTKILDSERHATESASLHIFAYQESDKLDVCTYTASVRTRELFAGKCDFFVPLGKRNTTRIPTDGPGMNASPEPTKDSLTNKNGTAQGDRNETRSTDDNGNEVPDAPLPAADSEENGSNPEVEQSDNEGTPAVASPSANATVTPSPSMAASPRSSPSGTPSPAVTKSPSSSPSASSSQAKASNSATPSTSALASPSLNSTETDDSESACFPGAAKVLLPDGSLKLMKELRTGDYVVDGSGEVSRVLTFAHANPRVVSVFVLIKFEGGELPISSQHYMPINGVLATADSARAGDSIRILQSLDGIHRSARVTGVELVSMTGLYNPQTASGSIAVLWKGSTVVASTYTRAVHPVIAHLMMVPLRWLDHVSGIVVPLFAHALRDGSLLWRRLLPQGSTTYEL